MAKKSEESCDWMACATDVSLPYEPQAVNWNKIAKGLSSHKTTTSSKEAKATCKRRRNRKKTAPVQRSKTTTSTVSRTLAKVEEIWMSLVFDEDEEDKYLDEEEDVIVVEPKTQPTTGTAASPLKPTPKSGEASARSSSSRSSRSSSSESSIRERSRWANIVVAIVTKEVFTRVRYMGGNFIYDEDMNDVKKLKNTNQLVEASKNLTAEDLMILSRDQGKLFDRLMVENTKQSLFLTQPTKEEVRLWNGKNEARKPKNPEMQKLDFQDTTVEFKQFCLECCPRHPSDYPYYKIVPNNG
uniref:Uncharacterized protein n=1 Tax=Romanomermis culicivorax TaxID=13658 RepID=A0A915KIR5_ROMCU